MIKKQVDHKTLFLYSAITALIMTLGTMLVKPSDYSNTCSFEKVEYLDSTFIDYLIEHPVMKKYNVGKGRIVLDCTHDEKSLEETIGITVVYNVLTDIIPSREESNSNEAEMLKQDTYKFLNRSGAPANVAFYTQIEAN